MDKDLLNTLSNRLETFSFRVNLSQVLLYQLYHTCTVEKKKVYILPIFIIEFYSSLPLNAS